MNFRSPTAGPRRWGIIILVSASLAFLALVAFLATWFRSQPETIAPKRAPLGDGRWEPTSEGDFEEQSAGFAGDRLRLRAATRRTRTDTVKFLGVRHREPVRLTEGARIAVDIDWNRQSNGSGLTAGLVLAPDSTAGNPYALPEYLWVEFIGVPPGKNARRVIGMRKSSHHRHFDAEGWPETNRDGRPIAVQRIEIRVGKDGAFRVFENGTEAYASAPEALGFDRAYVYLQMSSRTNYPPREVFFDHIEIEPGK